MELYILLSFVHWSSEAEIEGVFTSLDLIEKAKVEVKKINSNISSFEVQNVILNKLMCS